MYTTGSGLFCVHLLEGKQKNLLTDWRTAKENCLRCTNVYHIDFKAR